MFDKLIDDKLAKSNKLVVGLLFWHYGRYVSQKTIAKHTVYLTIQDIDDIMEILKNN